MNTNNTAVRLVTVSDDEAGQRIDNFLKRHLKGVPKSLIYRVLRKGEVRVNKKRIKPDYKLIEEDLVRIPPIRVSEEKPPPSIHLNQVAKLESCILFEDDCLLVLNKPSGIAVHGGSGLSFGVIEALRALRPKSPYLELVHRIDRDTSGILLIAKKRSTLRELHRQLREKTIRKDYLALVYGEWPRKLRQIDAPLRKNVLASGERLVKVDSELGKPSITRYELNRPLDGMTLLKASPLTGRTHQIRVHCQHAGYTIAGDDKYATSNELEQSRALGLNRLFLHAWKIRFEHPKLEEPLEIVAPLPGDLDQIVQSISHK